MPKLLLGAIRVAVFQLVTSGSLAVTAEVASSSLVVLAILLNGLQRTPKSNLGPFGSNKHFCICRFAVPSIDLARRASRGRVTAISGEYAANPYSAQELRQGNDRQAFNTLKIAVTADQRRTERECRRGYP